ncbi:unnamed protein product [Amoebophrya sp. A25]|nr:unnamed protein product [Amoebophrya sp. A25]|eukprot:GSA25T00020041001.1
MGVTSRQQALLEDIAALTAPSARASSSSVDAKTAVPSSATKKEEEFFRLFYKLEKEYEEEVGASYLTNWAWIFHTQKLCHNVCDSLADAAERLAQVEHLRREVAHKCEVLHFRCEHLLKEQNVLEEYTKSIGEKLDRFDRLMDLKRILDRPGGTIGSSLDQAEFERCLDLLDDGIEFLDRHPEYYDSQQYFKQYDQMRRRACQSLKNQVTRSLNHTMDQVLDQMDQAGKDGRTGYETSVFYVRFRAAATQLKPLTYQLHKRRDAAEIYGQTLDEVESFFVALRIRLVTNPLQLHMHNVMSKFQEDPAGCIRQISTYVLKLCILEKQTFLSYFEARQPQETLDSLIKHFGALLYDLVRPLILSFDEIDILREIADALQLDILHPHQVDVASGKSEHELVALLGIVLRLYRDVQERLIFRVQIYIRDEIKGFLLDDPARLEYPRVLFTSSTSSRVSETGSEEEKNAKKLEAMAYALQRGSSYGNFVTLERTLLVLSKIFRVLEINTFQGLAQEAVDACISTLKVYAAKIPQRTDSSLFLIKHLLILREQVVSFECDLVCKEKFFDFAAIYGNVKDAFAEASQSSSHAAIAQQQQIGSDQAPGAIGAFSSSGVITSAAQARRDANSSSVLRISGKLFRILTPKLTETRIDSKKNMETELRNACELLIQDQIQLIAEPLVVFNAKVTQHLGSGEKELAATQLDFLQPDALAKLNKDFLDSVSKRVPLLCARMRIYLTNRFESDPPALNPDGTRTPAAAEASRPALSCSSAVLFRPIHISLVESVSQLWSLFREFDVKFGVGSNAFVTQEALDLDLADTMARVEAMDYKELLQEFFADEIK